MVEKGNFGDDLRPIRGNAHKTNGHEGGSVRPQQKRGLAHPLLPLVWPEDTGRVKEKDKPGNN